MSFSKALHLGPQGIEPLLRGFPSDEELRSYFHSAWGAIEERMELALTSEEALRLFPSLVIYDMPDGTRSTLTVRPDVEVGVDAALYCAALIHVLRGLGSRSCIIMTHTYYNRARGEEGLERILKIMSEGATVLKTYASMHGVGVHLVGMQADYELRNRLTFDAMNRSISQFNAHFLVDHAEERFMDPRFKPTFDPLPDVDVCIRHTKLNMAGGWIPGKLLRSTFMYSQNGTLFSNWEFDELVAMVTVALLAKLLHKGEGLVKMYGDVDEVKRRYQLRELRLFNQVIALRSDPKKLFVIGHPAGLCQLYY
jgi:hypothetical protein